MRKYTFGLIILTITVACYGQKRKDLVLSISAGKLMSPYYLNNTFGKFFNVDFDYYISKRHIISASYFDGHHNYYDNILSTDPNYIKSDGTNSIAKYHTSSILYKYKFLNKRSIDAIIGAGAGIMTHSKRYPYLTASGSVFQEETWTDIVFPTRLEFEYRLNKNFKLGLMWGLFIAPDFPILAYHIGPRLTYIVN